MHILKKIFIFIKGVFFVMSKFAQSFSRYRPVFKLDEKTNVLKLTDEKIDIQDEVNSSFDESLYSRLEAYFEQSENHVQISNEISDDYDGYGNDADEVLSILESVSDLRSRYNLSEDLYSISEVLSFVRNQAQAQNNLPQPQNQNESQTITEGGEKDEKNPEQKSE